MEIKKGYKQTEIGIIPEDWEVKSVGNVCVFTNGIAHENYVVEYGVYIIVNSKFISSDGKIVKYSSKQLLPIEENTILMVMSDVPNGKAIAKCYLAKRNFCGTLNQRICKLNIKANDCIEYVFYIINRNKFYLGFDDGVKQTNLRKIDVLNCQIPLPPPQEQSAIATVLSDMDEYILSLERLIAKKKAIKQGTMQNLLTGKIRLKGFNGEWVEKPLLECVDLLQGLTYSPSNVKSYGLLVLRSSNIKNGKLVFDDCVFVDCSVDENKYVKPSDILICVRNGSSALIGKSCVIDKPINATFGAFMSVLRGDNTGYIAHMFASNIVQTQIRNRSNATINQITKRDFEDIVFSIPIDEKEQTAIATILYDMDSEIEALQTKLQKAKLIKQGAMQNLLTGQIRLI